MLDLTKITPDPINPQKFVKSRDDSNVWIYWVSSYIQGAVSIGFGRRSIKEWDNEGRSRHTGDSCSDLIMVEPETVLYANDYGEREEIEGWYYTKEDADEYRLTGRSAIITKRIKGDKVTVEYEDLRAKS